MTMLETFTLISGNLIPILFGVLLTALFLRYLAFHAGKQNQAYFNSFSRSLQKILEDESQSNESISDTESWMAFILNRVSEHLPDRNFRFAGTGREQQRSPEEKKKSSVRGSLRQGQDLEKYVLGKKSIILSVRQQVDAFRSPYPPNFTEITRRILEQDVKWRSLVKVIPMESLSRIFEILPGLFIVGGIFGTFLGITAALPKIATIDLNNLHEATPILNSFVADIAFSMNTSIAGILCSVIMTVLLAFFPLESVREDVMRNMEQAFEFMWYQLHAGRMSKAEKSMINELRSIRETLDKSQVKKRETKSISRDKTAS